MVVKEFFNRLLGIGAEFANQEMPITPTEVLVALHTVDPAKCDLKCTVKATSICMAEKEIYTQEVLAACLQQMTDLTPTPTLLMRTVIQSFTMYPKLSLFVVNLLQRLILKQVWKQKVIWDGFLKCCQRLKPHSLSTLIQLPHPQLAESLKLCPDLRAPLLEYAEQIQENQLGHISQQMMDIITGNLTDVFVTVSILFFVLKLCTICTNNKNKVIENMKIKETKEEPTGIQNFPAVFLGWFSVLAIFRTVLKFD